ncbi:ParA family protein (plasmid) [Borrelia miyamotoi]|uniref:PF32-like protein n=1 Tax=Borrelia miyamotoi TaxID=47466 RepID=A0A0U3G409_9SPIR|nr:ParA family protein [Borrelia miyamotoi]ALU34119.1 PF32-like protein [Borrelia miyamotoi]AOW96398.1 chromosome partitioning protein ParA [Borrelia miyamotoi]ASQ29678.1 chromosome partitioning protein ParA [Borrelia miyamotoi]QFP42335.1 ParA family protein [Borrelia miyamotoi]QFP48455.1 ParA family protein [Borrelia miyamotoi]
MDTKETKVITVASIKGGVGKSTTSLIFASLLSQSFKVLIIDIDTQASTTSYYFKVIKERGLDLFNNNIYEVLISNLHIDNSVVSINNNLDLIPSYLTLHKFNSEAIPYKEFRLKEQLKLLSFKYDYVILDTNPSLDFTLTNALVCSDYIIVPITAEKWAVESLDLFNFFIEKLSIRAPIYLINTKFKRNNTHKELLNILKENDNFLGTISEREDLNRKIAKNDVFDLNKDYIKEYQNTLLTLMKKIKGVMA